MNPTKNQFRRFCLALAVTASAAIISASPAAQAAPETDPSLGGALGQGALPDYGSEGERAWIEDPLTPPWKLPDDTVVARVDDEAILKGDLMDWATMLMTQHGIDSNTVEGQEWLENVAPNILDTLITYRILKREAENAIPLPTDEEIEELVQPVVERFGGEEKLEAYLLERDLSLADYKEIMKQDTQFNRFIREKSLDFAGPDISERMVERYYNRNIEQFDIPKAVKFQEIFIMAGNPGTNQEWKDARQKAENLHAQIQSGADMGELAMEHSEAGSARDGGVLPYVLREQVTDPHVAGILFQLDEGQLSKPRRARYGYYILKVLDIIEPHRVPLNEKVTEDIKAAIREDRMKQGMSEWIKDQREQHYITVRGKVVNDPAQAQ